jgi:EAL domain-containing protein (putative c-di-GMP-specific phosphodiesterase class I)/CheY-like chemotaxis protein
LGTVKGRVLAVDDEPGLLEVYESLLADEGFVVETATSGRDALEQFRREPFDVVLTDIVMPDRSGVEVLRAVRRSDLDVPVILVTGSPTVETAVLALELGALRYLVKPVRGTDLVAAVAQAVRLHRLALLKREALTHLGASDKLVGDRAGLEATFGRAISSMWLAYQPVWRAVDGRIFGHEALLRTAEPTVPNPGAFLAAAERLGRVQELGRATRKAIAGSCGLVGNHNLLVNLHPQDLTDETLYSPESPLAQRARQVVLEVTERASLDGLHDIRDRVKTLRQLGFRIAIDDLGAGYAGLTSFAVLEPDMVKIDMDLVRNVDSEPIKRKLIGSITSLCKELGILVVAEGIETEAERAAVVDLGCDLLQGFLLGRPSRQA